MAYLSLLPERYAFVETWITRLFLFLGLVTIGPWAGLLIYDFVLYIFRCIAYEFPVVGGRAQGTPRPRAPSLTERSTGRQRRFSMARRPEEANVRRAEQSNGARPRHIAEEKDEG